MVDKCFRAYDGVWAEDDTYSPCLLDNDQCCGNGDQCMGHNICYSAGNSSVHMDYYVAGCTDSTGKNSACQSTCLNERNPALVWNPSGASNLWACCGTGNIQNIGCSTPNTTATFSAPSRDDLDAYRKTLDDAGHAVKLAAGVIAAIVIACVVVLALGCFCLWRCCFSRKARDKRNRGKFVPLGNTHRGEDIWNANVQDHGQGHELHDGPAGNYGYGGNQQGAPYNPPHQAGPQYTVANFR